ncbi:MAG TPA: 3-hydroxyacyl-CoA dehydrogenase/enoyl-CoA hydratase family protein [Bacteroidetes bacterium]|nr:3-hydroxyacyl-CoA dehydrogenase/enoyl-CoA hydratase family protein [Bacteroidota bacterium]
MHKITDYEWIIEVIIENPKIKKELFEKVEKYRTKGTPVTTNTSGIPIWMLAEGRSEDFKKYFMGTHFFNPPRYLPLLELIPGKDTLPEVVAFFKEFGDKYLGKQPVMCKDTPGFIANRVGLFSMAKLMDLTLKYNFTIEEVDALTGPVIGRPKTGTYRLMDLVGIDVADKVLKGLIQNAPEDEYLKTWQDRDTPEFMKYLLENKFLGNKTRQGFYKRTKEKDKKGKSIILAFDIYKNEYRDKIRPSFELVKENKKIDNLKNKIVNIFESDKPEANFLKEYFLGLFSYVSNRIPEISDYIYSIDDGMKAGYAWDAGPFEYWDMIGVEKGVEEAEKMGYEVAGWVKDMLKSGKKSFYEIKNYKKYYYDIFKKDYEKIPGIEEFIILDLFRDKKPVYKNSEAIIHDIGDGVLNIEFISKSNVIGEGTGLAMQKAVELAEEEGWNGIVIGNNAKQFSVGANLMMVAMLAFQKDFKKLDEITNDFQQVNMRLRYSKIPVVVATQGYVFGGGVELSMHADSVVASSESYIGLVEVGVGLLPGGGGTKEFAVRLSESMYPGDVVMPKLIESFKTIATAQVATSADEAFDLKYLDATRDSKVMNTMRAIATAKNKVLQMADTYVMPDKKEVKVMGRTGMATLLAAINEFKLGGYITEYESHIAKKIAYVMCGGDLTGEHIVSEQYLLDIEREAFLSLLGEPKTMERIQYMLENNKPLRN